MSLFFKFWETKKYGGEIAIDLERRTFGLGVKIYHYKGSFTLQFQVLNLSFYAEVSKKPQRKWGKP